MVHLGLDRVPLRQLRLWSQISFLLHYRAELVLLGWVASQAGGLLFIWEPFGFRLIADGRFAPSLARLRRVQNRINRQKWLFLKGRRRFVPCHSCRLRHFSRPRRLVHLLEFQTKPVKFKQHLQLQFLAVNMRLAFQVLYLHIGQQRLQDCLLVRKRHIGQICPFE